MLAFKAFDICNYSLNRDKKYNKMITDLPKFESNFEILHKKFYDV